MRQVIKKVIIKKVGCLDWIRRLTSRFCIYVLKSSEIKSYQYTTEYRVLIPEAHIKYVSTKPHVKAPDMTAVNTLTFYLTSVCWASCSHNLLAFQVTRWRGAGEESYDPVAWKSLRYVPCCHVDYPRTPLVISDILQLQVPTPVIAEHSNHLQTSISWPSKGISHPLTPFLRWKMSSQTHALLYTTILAIHCPKRNPFKTLSH